MLGKFCMAAPVFRFLGVTCQWISLSLAECHSHRQHFTRPVCVWRVEQSNCCRGNWVLCPFNRCGSFWHLIQLILFQLRLVISVEGSEGTIMGTVYKSPTVCGNSSHPQSATIEDDQKVLRSNKLQQFIISEPFSKILDSRDDVSGSVECVIHVLHPC